MLKHEKTESAYLVIASKDKKKVKRERKIKMLQFKDHKRNNRKNRMRMTVTSVELQVMRRSTVPTITHGMERNVCFLTLFVMNLI